MKFLKVDGYEVLFGDDASHERLDTVPQRELIERIEYAAALSLEKLRPSMVLLPARSFNQDHVATFRACMAATRPASAGARHLVPYVLAYDNTTAFWAAPDEWFVPNVFVDISEYVDTKVEAVRRYRSQLRRRRFTPARRECTPPPPSTAARCRSRQPRPSRPCGWRGERRSSEDA